VAAQGEIEVFTCGPERIIDWVVVRGERRTWGGKVDGLESMLTTPLKLSYCALQLLYCDLHNSDVAVRLYRNEIR
jgi:hypothetical protein